MVEKERPLYVGETDDFRVRWHARLRDIHQVGLTRSDNKLRMPLTVWFGQLSPNTKMARKTAEHALIRALINAGFVLKDRLRNSKAIEEFRVIGNVCIKNLFPKGAWKGPSGKALGPRDPDKAQYFKNRVLTLPMNATYELFGR
ncbi:hypothetical protein [Corallococcus carmarthensis]|uniref:hypothetical protein n=1 Tax=Corallococcus carmarthensis TaxID=2316728 RepID=UPI0011C43026|nr:hypothetical protein [Corallococcus carmarthensis]